MNQIYRMIISLLSASALLPLHILYIFSLEKESTDEDFSTVKFPVHYVSRHNFKKTKRRIIHIQTLYYLLCRGTTYDYFQYRSMFWLLTSTYQLSASASRICEINTTSIKLTIVIFLSKISWGSVEICFLNCIHNVQYKTRDTGETPKMMCCEHKDKVLWSWSGYYVSALLIPKFCQTLPCTVSSLMLK